MFFEVNGNYSFGIFPQSKGADVPKNSDIGNIEFPKTQPAKQKGLSIESEELEVLYDKYGREKLRELPGEYKVETTYDSTGLPSKEITDKNGELVRVIEYEFNDYGSYDLVITDFKVNPKYGFPDRYPGEPQYLVVGRATHEELGDRITKSKSFLNVDLPTSREELLNYYDNLPINN